jgi:crotonobetainyl-CoA:carnitine CoA-transferase CaiB-like acyl-CoA transferase
MSEVAKSQPENPLAGIRVLELGQYIAGPLAGQQLADFGAEVIKIERPGTGDPFRVYDNRGPVPNYAYNFRAFNRKKKSLALDLQKPEAREILKRLVADVDVLLENFRPGVLDRLGLGYETLKSINPMLIFCSISGFFGDGPNKERPAFDTIGQALTGMLDIFSNPDEPRMRGTTIADQATALQASNAIMAALFGRERTKTGGKIDLTMIDATASFMPDIYAAHTDARLEVHSELRPAGSQAFVLRCADDEIIAVQMGGVPKNFTRVLDAVGCPELALDPLFSDRAMRVPNWSKFLQALAPHFRKYSRDQLLVRLQERDIPCSPVLSIAEAIQSSEMVHSGLFETIDHPKAGPLVMMKRAARINNSRGFEQTAPAVLGEHTTEILRDAGYTQEEVAALIDASVVATSVA